jgi:hypothetical protein
MVYVRYRRQDLPLGPSDIFSRLNTLFSCADKEAGGSSCAIFFGEEGSDKSAVERGRWS